MVVRPWSTAVGILGGALIGLQLGPLVAYGVIGARTVAIVAVCWGLLAAAAALLEGRGA